MNRIFKRASVFFAALVLFVAQGFSLPAVTPYLDDVSGEYVFYRDTSFSTESIVGFLHYSATTYAVRYYSKADVKKKRPEKDITIYVTIDPASKNLLLTGERIVGAGPYEDSDIINYMHDMLYEFCARRQRVDLPDENPKTVDEEFAQFGGKVAVSYNPYVPIFNIDKISSVDGKEIFYVEVTGCLTSSSDTSFSSFRGLSVVPSDRKHEFKKKNFKKIDVTYGNQKISIDENWTQSPGMDNMYLLGESAFLTFAQMKLPADEISRKKIKATLVRKICQGTTLSYAIWSEKKIEQEGNKLTIMNIYYQPDSENVTRDFKVMTELSDGTMSYMTLTVFDSIYRKNKDYFSRIISSYSAN